MDVVGTINFSRMVILNPFRDLSKEEIDKVKKISLICAIAFPILGGIIALYITPIFFRREHVKKVRLAEAKKISNICSPILPFTPSPSQISRQITPSSTDSIPNETRKSYSKETLDLLELFGVREDSHEHIDHAQILSIIDFLKRKIPLSAQGAGKEKTSEEIWSTEEGMRAFLQAVNDYTLTIFVPLPTGCWKNPAIPPTLTERIAHAKEWVRLNEKRSIPLRTNPTDVTCIPLELFFLKFLRELRISSPILLGVSSRIGNLESMERLSLTHNPLLDSLPSEIGSMNISLLDLTGNSSLKKIPSLPSRLQTLRLKNCAEITSLPENISKIEGLQEVTCQGCSKLNEISKEIVRNPALRELNLIGCKSLVVPEEIRREAMRTKSKIHIPLS